MSDQFKIYIICEDLVLGVLLNKILNISLHKPVIVYYKSFSDVKSIREGENPGLVILDDIITGSASHEIANILRLEKKIKCPVYYLSNAEYGEEKKALYRGANYFFRKPFNPDELTQHIIDKTSAKPKQVIITEKEIVNKILN